jgi:hypothetical protein
MIAPGVVIYFDRPHKWRKHAHMKKPQRQQEVCDRPGVAANRWLAGLACWLACGSVLAQVAADSATPAKETSPWLFVPLVSSNPKLGTSLSLMGGYAWKFDAASPPSLVATQVQRSSTDSSTLGVMAKLYFNGDADRLEMGLGLGRIKNDYEDFLGTGLRIRTNEKIDAIAARYQHRVAPSWYVGAQFVRGNYDVSGADELSEQALQDLALNGARSVGIGAVTTFDTRSNVNNPATGMYAQLSTFSYRKGLGSDDAYDKLQGDWRWYKSVRPHNVLVLRASGAWTWDAPTAKQSTVLMRGYTRGQYLGRHVTSLEVEDRHMLQPKWGAKVFAGVNCLYGSGVSCGNDQLFPMAGAGAFYILKPDKNMLVSTEVAFGKRGNKGFYLRFGHPF